MLKAVVLAFFIAVVSLPPRSFGYGAIGHQIVGAIADQRLAGTPTGKKIAVMLDGFTLQNVAVIPDEIKGWDKKGADDPGIFHYSSRPKIDAQLRDFWRANQPTHDVNSPIPSHHWFHYTDVPLVTPQKYRDGAAGRTKWDIVHMTSYCVRVLKGDEPEENERKITKPIAVILLAHYLGDIHQPLHVGAEYFDQQGRPADPDKTPGALEDQGGNSLTIDVASGPGASKAGKRTKFHGYWDNNTVLSLLPELPDTMPKEERRAKTDAARDELVRSMATQEPKGWRLAPTTDVKDYGEAWADEILPIAREAHERLQISNVHPKQEEDRVFAEGIAQEKPAPDHVSYSQWASNVVRDELHKAGWRLADLLEKTVK
jgi:hypothetical protein